MKMTYRPLVVLVLTVAVGAMGCGGEDPVRPNLGSRDSGTSRNRDSGTLPTATRTPWDAGSLAFGDGGLTSQTGVDAGAGGRDAGPVPAGGELPCDVAEILATRCATCHSDPPILNAPMPLVSLADLKGTWNGQPIASRVMARIHDSASPMPPSGQLEASQLATMDAWIANGAPAGPLTQDCGGSTVVDPDEIACPNKVSFYSHADGNMNAPAPVPTGQNEYICYYFRSPFNTNQVAGAWLPHITNTDHVHHWILYRLASLPAGATDGSARPCSAAGGGTFIMGWAPGQGPTVLTEDVGLQLAERSGEWLSLQIHYWNPQGAAGQTDNSGVDFCVEEQPREHMAGTLAIVGAVPTMQPRTMGTATGNCANITRPLTIIGSGPHMHNTGTRFRTELIRTNGERNLFVDVNPWRFDEQTTYMHSPPIQVNAGDRMVVTCDYYNNTNRVVRFGEETEMEMCMNFALVYPIQNAPTGFIFGRECGAPVPFGF